MIDPGLAALRHRLKQLNVWPEAGDQFVEMMPHFLWHAPPLTEKDAQWLPQVVDDATKGVDIGATYPAFFQKLLSSESLRQSFLTALDNKCKMA